MGRAGGPLLRAIWGPLELPDGSDAFARYAQLGVDVYQVQLRWSDVAPRRPREGADPRDPAYDWGAADVGQALRRATAHDIDVAVLVTATPAWANGGAGETVPPARDSDFATFLSAAAARYPQVRRWLVWGEPNRGDRWRVPGAGERASVRRYAALLDAAHAALKRASGENVVIGGNLFTGGEIRPPRFIAALRLPSGRPPRLDLFGFNPYPFAFPDLDNDPIKGGWRDISDLDTVTRELAAAWAPERPPGLWLSEFTVQSDQDSSVFAFHVSRAEQARWLTAGYRAAAAVPSVRALGWFTLLDQPPRPGAAHWGLLTSEGEPKPAARAYARLCRDVVRIRCP